MTPNGRRTGRKRGSTAKGRTDTRSDSGPAVTSLLDGSEPDVGPPRGRDGVRGSVMGDGLPAQGRSMQRVTVTGYPRHTPDDG
ncbi:hypothetical protein GCM10025792_49280 [Pseudonocardia tropica]